MKTKIVTIAIIIFLSPFAVCHAQNEREKGLEKLGNGPKELCEAIEKGNIKAVKTIIKKGIDVNLPVKKNGFPLFYAAGCGRPEIARLLIQAGANVNIKDSYGDTALHIAIRECNPVVAEILINSGADVNAKIQKGFFPGFQPLHTAVNGKKDIPHLVSLLISKGAQINSRDAKGKTPLQYARMNRFHQSEQILLKHEKVLGNFKKKTHFPAIKGSYLGQKPPGMTPEVFAPGFISTDKRELNSVFTPEGKEFYYSIQTPGLGYKIYYTKETENGWTMPQPVPFSSNNSDVDMCITSDGKRMYFGSTRPINGVEQDDFKIWYVDRVGAEWSEAKYLESPINEGKRALYPTVSEKGTMFFQAIRKDVLGERDIYYSELVKGEYTEPVHLGSEINTKYGEGDVLIAPDESYMIVNSNGRPDDLGKGDLYISFKKEDGTWTELTNMGDKINTSETEYCPMLSPNGKYFFFTSRRTGNGDIYWVDARIIEELAHIPHIKHKNHLTKSP